MRRPARPPRKRAPWPRLLAIKHNQGSTPTMLARVTRLFPLWAVLVSIAAYFSPASFSGVAPHVTTLLTIIMLAMGVTLSVADFQRVFTRPAPVIAGIVLHYLVMPLAAWGIAKVLHMPPDLTAGM